MDTHNTGKSINGTHNENNNIIGTQSGNLLSNALEKDTHTYNSMDKDNEHLAMLNEIFSSIDIDSEIFNELLNVKDGELFNSIDLDSSQHFNDLNGEQCSDGNSQNSTSNDSAKRNDPKFHNETVDTVKNSTDNCAFEINTYSSPDMNKNGCSGAVSSDQSSNSMDVNYLAPNITGDTHSQYFPGLAHDNFPQSGYYGHNNIYNQSAKDKVSDSALKDTKNNEHIGGENDTYHHLNNAKKHFNEVNNSSFDEGHTVTNPMNPGFDDLCAYGSFARDYVDYRLIELIEKVRDHFFAKDRKNDLCKKWQRDTCHCHSECPFEYSAHKSVRNCKSDHLNHSDCLAGKIIKSDHLQHLGDFNSYEGVNCGKNPNITSCPFASTCKFKDREAMYCGSKGDCENHCNAMNFSTNNFDSHTCRGLFSPKEYKGYSFSKNDIRNCYCNKMGFNCNIAEKKGKKVDKCCYQCEFDGNIIATKGRDGQCCQNGYYTDSTATTLQDIMQQISAFGFYQSHLRSFFAQDECLDKRRKLMVQLSRLPEDALDQLTKHLDAKSGPSKEGSKLDRSPLQKALFGCTRSCSSKESPFGGY